MNGGDEPSPTSPPAAQEVKRRSNKSQSSRGAHLNHGTRACIAFGGVRVDAAVATEVLRLLQPLGIEAALEAVAMREEEHAETRRQTELALTQAR